jgi:DNA-binding transcriptional LysR family regulator
MELRQLRAFREVVRTGTFRAAAAALHLTQPAIWQQVRSLQDELGVSLFERSGRRVRLTRTGAQLLARSEAVLASAGALEELARHVREGREGIVSVATPAAPVQLVLADAIGAFARAHPKVHIDLRVTGASRTGPLDALHAGEVDVAVGPRSDDLAHSLDGCPLSEIHVAVLSARDHVLRASKRIEVERLRDEPLLVGPPGSLSRALLGEACTRAGFEPFIRLASASPVMLVALARTGFGVAVVASDALVGVTTPSVSRATLVEHRHKLGVEIWIYWRRGPLTPAVERFIGYVRARRPHANTTR